ncbi:VCBS repeat-containing protein [Zobellia uliginosa]|uniref:VCBS repeat-containing protein n=1 Tax=Zobellia uliginosa TaxID=143224 RepID=UPI001C07B281|nr:VCBS repeat-containing protein [Zobellia uliginosa]MBU2946173.1 VCBS repeat-containing protein [Zobellia uliginosa]
MKKIVLPLIILFIVFSCAKKNRVDKNFIEIGPSISGVDFSNTIIENDTLNYFSFPYLYLGAGVSTGDINNDGLSDIYFTGNLTPNKLYLNKGNLQFEDITEKAGIAGDNRWYSGTTMADVNNDGYLDIYLSVSGKFSTTANQLFINNGDNTFTEKAASYGIADESISIQSTFFDYDNDGFLDLFVANYPNVLVSMGNHYYKNKMDLNAHEDSGHLYKNNGDGTFSDITEKSGVQNFGLTLGLVASDFNNDGFKDLYVSNDFNVPDYLYQNNGDGTFTEISKDVAKHTSMFGMGLDVNDFNNDGLADILQVDMTAADYKRSKTNMASMSPETFYESVDLGFNYQYMQNSLQLNNGISHDNKPVFSEISRFSNMSTTDWSWGAQFADFNNDGWKDAFISNGVKRDVNNNDVNAKYKSENFFGENKDKDYRLMPSTPISNYAFANNQDLSFSNVSKEWGLDKAGFSNGFAYADLDLDGDLDLVINNLDSPASIYENKNIENNNYLRVKLQGEKNNPFALGAKVVINEKTNKQTQELTLTRGYQSSVEPIVHFGLGQAETDNSVKVIWPNGQMQQIEDVSSNQLLIVKYDALKTTSNHIDETDYGFTEVSNIIKPTFKHTEDVYDDFEIEPLLPHRYSQLGAKVATGDINSDGLEDFFIGNAKGSSGAMYIQDKDGEFTLKTGPWEKDLQYEDTGVLLFDADNDKDLDLYVVNGGNHTSVHKDYYQDRLYINTPQGFMKSAKVLPEITASGQEVVTADYDNDGDLDLFVGGRIVPGKYPFPAQSYILRNDGGKDLDLKFTNVTEKIAPELSKAGMVTSAVWDDFDNDNKMDLIVTGEWMPISFFKNNGQKFTDVTDDLGFTNSIGWWYSLEKADVDADGDMDYLVGNLGLNYKYKASEETPFEVYANDFDENGSMDIVLSYKKKGTILPLRGRECSSQQVPAIKKRFETFESFANADLNDIYGEKMLKKALHYKANTFANSWVENNNGEFIVHKLPTRAQFTSINKFEIFDYNGDNFPDILIGGNLYEAEVETPRNDSGIGLVLVGNSKGHFEVLDMNESGFYVPGEIRDIKSIKIGNQQKPAFIFARNNDSLLLIEQKK